MVNWIETAVLDIIWLIFISGPLYIISGVYDVLHYLSGGIIIQDLFFNGDKKFDFNDIPFAFWGFCIFAAAVICIIFCAQYISLLFSESTEIKNKFVKSIKMSAFACVFVFFIPITFFLLNQAIMFFATNLDKFFGFKTANQNISGILWYIGDPKWNGTDVYNGSFFTPPPNILDYNIIAEIISVLFITYAMVMTTLLLAQKNFELFFLFIISPLVAVSMVNDNGKRMNVWKDMVIAKALGSIGSLVSYFVFIVAINLVLHADLSDLGVVGKQLLLIVLLCGGALACLAASTMVANLVGEAVGLREGMAAMSSLMSGGLFAWGAAKTLGKGAKLGGKAAHKTGKGAKWALGGNKREADEKNPDDPDNEGGFQVPFEGLRTRSGLVGAVGDFLAHGTNTAYALTHHPIDSISETLYEGGAKVADGVTKAYTATKDGLSATKDAFKANTHSTWKGRKTHNKEKNLNSGKFEGIEAGEEA